MDEAFANQIFFDVVDNDGLDISKTIQQLDDYADRRGSLKTSMLKRLGSAMDTPLKHLTFDQVRLLVSQQEGLAWLAKPVLKFLTDSPDSECSFYPGDLMMAALRVGPKLVEIAPAEIRALTAIGLSWSDGLSFDPELLAEARDLFSRLPGRVN